MFEIYFPNINGNQFSYWHWFIESCVECYNFIVYYQSNNILKHFILNISLYSSPSSPKNTKRKRDNSNAYNRMLQKLRCIKETRKKPSCHTEADTSDYKKVEIYFLRRRIH